jgi:ParB/RepB/Spo0J family partition protein
MIATKTKKRVEGGGRKADTKRPAARGLADDGGEGMFARGPQTEDPEGTKNGDKTLRELGDLRGSMDISLKRIFPCRFQPRQDFPAEEIDGLAASIKQQGLHVPIKVRVRPDDPDNFELIFGERRLRAAKLLKLPTIRAEVGEYSDAAVRQMILVEVLQRKDLNAIEEARAMKAAIDAGDAAGPTELAEQLGLTQGHISNRLRLLGLPETVQARVISQEIPATHARSICRYKDSPPIMKELLEAVSFHTTRGGGLGSSSEWDDNVDRIAYNATKPIGGTRYSDKLMRSVPVFTPTEEQRAQLGLVNVSRGYMRRGRNKPELRAANVKLWDKLQGEYEATLAKKEADLLGSPADNGSAKKAKATKAKPLTAAEKKRQTADKDRKDKEQAEQFAKRLYGWKEDWMRYVIAQHLLHCADIAQITRVFMLCLDHWDCNKLGVGTLKPCSKHPVRDVFSVQDFDLDREAGKLAAQIFYDEENGPAKLVFDEDLESLCEFGLEIDLACEWNNHQAGPMSEAYWRLHAKDQLVELAGELKAGFADDVLRGTKEQLVAAFLAKIPKEEDKEAGLPLPKEIRKAKKSG